MVEPGSKNIEEQLVQVLDSEIVQIRQTDHAGIREAFYTYYLDNRKKQLVGPNKVRDRLIRRFQNTLCAYSDTQQERRDQ